MNSQVASRSACIVGVSGGLGNQLFQYAAGRTIALRTDSQLQLDLSFYNKGRHRTFELDKLPVEAEFIRSAEGFSATRHCQSLFRKAFRTEKTYREPHYHYDRRFESVQSPVTLEGYFQSERYFASHAAFIRAELAIPEPQDAESQNLARQMAEVTPTALHIRRGDYVTSPKNRQLFASCPIDYYRQAMEQIPGNGPVFVFSDDTDWVKQNLPAVKPLVFSAANSLRPALADLWLMTQSHHHIIANSSFSWWGAWLAGAQKGLTIAPRKWFNDAAVNDSDLIPDHWIRL